MNLVEKNLRLELQLLEESRERILQKCAHWRSCQDGSYECALDAEGFYKLVNQIKELKLELAI
jgi:hypothetical protein